jgi:hypothetical protein
MASERKRLALAATSLRSLNESLAATIHRNGKHSDTELPGFICECANPECESIIRLALPTYELVRPDRHQFIVCPDHENDDIADVVERRAGYSIVRLHDDLASIVAN